MSRLIFLLTALLTQPSAAFNNEFGSGQMTFTSDTPNNTAQAMMLKASATIDVTAMTAKVSLNQSFKNDYNGWVHGTYVFPLPENAAVQGFSFQIDERVIKGVIEEKAAAKRQFEQAKKAGKQAAMLAQNRPNLFKIDLANIPPKAVIEAKLVYWQTVEYQQGVFSLRLPTTLTPRYLPGKRLIDGDKLEDNLAPISSGQGWAFNTQQVADATEISPPQTRSSLFAHPIEIKARIQAGLNIAEITSASHDIDWREENGQWQVTLASGSEPMNRDFVLSWAPQAGLAPAAAVFVEDINNERFASLMVMPPQSHEAKVETLQRNIVFVIDSSGSMAGTSMRQAKRALKVALNRLKQGDRFEVIDFDNVARALFNGSRTINAQTRAQALRFVEHLDADGGTEIASAIELALANTADENELRQVVFITDGSVGNEAALLSLIQKKLGHSRLFTVGIGSAPNSYFMRKAAEFGRGSFTYIGSLDEVEHKMLALFNKLEQPLLKDIQIHWPAGSQVEAYPASIPDLYAGEPLLIKAKMGAVGAKVLVTGKLKNQAWQRTITLPEAGHHNGIATLWARAKIEQLMDNLHSGSPENIIKPQVLSLALKHELTSKYTRFVAIDSQVTRPKNAPTQQDNIPNLMPAGSAMIAPWPNTATSASLSLYLSLVLFLLGLLLWRWQGEI